MKVLSPLSLAAVVATTTNAFLIPSSISVPELSVTEGLLKDPETNTNSHYAVYHSTNEETEKLGLNITLSRCRKHLQLNGVTIFPWQRQSSSRTATAPIVPFDELLFTSTTPFDARAQHQISYGTSVSGQSFEDNGDELVDINLFVHAVDGEALVGDAKLESTSIRLVKHQDGKFSFDRVLVFLSNAEVDGDDSDEEVAEDFDDKDLDAVFKFLPFVATTPRPEGMKESLLEELMNIVDGQEMPEGVVPVKVGHEHHSEEEHEDEGEHRHHHHHHHHHSHHGPPPPASAMACDQESSFISKTFCRTSAFFHDSLNFFTAPAYSPRRHGGCHWRPGMDSELRPDGTDETTPEGFVRVPSFPEGFPKPKGGPLKFMPRPDGDHHHYHDHDEQHDENEYKPGSPRDWEAYYGRPHHHHHHGHHGGIAGVLHWIVFTIIIPIFIGVAAGVLASAVGMVVGTGVAWCWIRFVRGGKRGQASKGSVAEEAVVVSEKELLIAADEKEAEAMEDAEVEVEAPPVYVEKA